MLSELRQFEQISAPKNLDGSGPIHPVLRSAIADPRTPHEVRRAILELQRLDSADAALEARLFVSALRADDVVATPAEERRGAREAFRDWKHTLPSRDGQLMAAEKLARVMDEWADAELDAEIRRDV